MPTPKSEARFTYVQPTKKNKKLIRKLAHKMRPALERLAQK